VANALTLANGLPRMKDVSGGGSITIKDEGTTIDANASIIDFTGTPVTATQISPGSVKVDITPATTLGGIYDETFTTTGTVPTGDPITLPSAKTYDSDELEVYLGGQRIEAGADFNYVGVAPRTQIVFTFDLNLGEDIRFRIDREVTDTPSIYDQSVNVVQDGAGVGQVNKANAQSGDAITLPSSKTYDDTELEVWVNGMRMQDIFDYNYVGVSPRTQIAFTFNLQVGDTIRFRIDRPT
jgi:hypothetical protein